MEPNPKKQPKKGEKQEAITPQMPTKLPDITQGVEGRNSEGIPYTVPPSKPYKPPRPLAINQVLEGTTVTSKFSRPKAYYPGTDETAGGTQFPKPSNTMVNKRNTKANTSTDGSGPSDQTSNANNPTDDLSNKKSAPEGKTKGAAPTGRTAVKHTTGVNFGPIEEDVHPAARRNTAHSNPDEIPDNQKTTADFLYEYDLMCLRDLIVAVGDLMTYSVNWNDLSTRRGRSSTCMYTNWSDADRAQRQAAELSLYRRDLSDIEPFITIDQEGGRVSRLRLIGQEPPNAQALRDKGDPNLIKQHGKLTGQILRLFGFNLDLCPVLDISYDDTADNSLKGRCWGKDTQQVIDNAGMFNRSMRAQGILSCAKHFPGYGPAECDPHEFLPVISKTRSEMEMSELMPYTALLPEIDSVMTCHSNYTAYDPDRPRWPASLSHNICTKLLRDQLGFEGLAMTDDLDMGAILNEVTFEQAIQEAVRAGNDLVMICHRLEMVELARQHLEGVEGPTLHDALTRIQKTKKRLVKPDKFDLARFDA
jgi:beta-N-acetylhexosaminidase